MQVTLRTIPVRGRGLDSMTRCIHYRSAVDIVAIKLRCCRTYYACFECHQEEVRHLAQRWPADEFGETAILCGACQRELTIREYLNCSSVCPACGASFNPRCALHYGLYFEVQSPSPGVTPVYHQR